MNTSTSHFSSLDLRPQLSVLSDAERGGNLDVRHYRLSAWAGEEVQRVSPKVGQLAVLATERCVV